MTSTRAAPLPVLVVGGGPVGMTAAAALACRNIPVVLVEAEHAPATDWRASTFHPPTLELLSELGVVEQMHEEGLAVPRYQFRDRRDGPVAEFDFGLLADETPYPHRLQLNQQHLVRMLAARLTRDPNVTVRFGATAVSLEQTSSSVTLGIETPTGPETVTGSYLVGADGASSSVRTLLDVGFEGFTYPERFLIVSTSVDMRALLPDIADVNYVADPDQWLFLLHTPESWRVVYPVPPEQSRERALDPEDVQAHLQGVARYAPGYPVDDVQVYSVHQRVAASFRVMRTVLVGDAAHINSPLGGVGLNSGIHDAMDVVRRIARISAGADADEELDTFATLRRRVALEYVQADTQRNTQRMSERDEERRRVNRAEMRAIAADPERARAWCRRASLLESVRRFGIGLAPDQVGEDVSASPGQTERTTA